MTLFLASLVLRLALPHPCVHTADERRPAFSHDEQAETERILAHAAEQLHLGADFHRLLHLVATRESSLQQGLVHRLDLDASAAAYRKTRALYHGHPLKREQEVWQTYGLFGMNSNYFTIVWDRQADPRELCDAFVDVLAYRRAAVNYLSKVATGGTARCPDDSGTVQAVRLRPTWEALHRAVSGGSLCPRERDQDFRQRARRHGLDPDGVVTLSQLGHEPPGSRLEKVAVLWLGLYASRAPASPDFVEPTKGRRLCAR